MNSLIIEFSDSRKINSTLRQLSAKLNAMEDCMVLHPAEGGALNIIQEKRAANLHLLDVDAASSYELDYNLLSTDWLENLTTRWDPDIAMSPPAIQHYLALKQHWLGLIRLMAGVPSPAEKRRKSKLPNQRSFLAPQQYVDLERGNNKINTKSCRSLLELSSYAMGRNAIDLSQDKLTSFYELLPAHTRKWVLWQHLCELVLKHTPLDDLLPWFGDICFAMGAEVQALDLYKGFFIFRGFSPEPLRKEEFRWAWDRMKSQNFTKQWTNFLSYFFSIYQITTFDVLVDCPLSSVFSPDNQGAEIACLCLEDLLNSDYHTSSLHIDDHMEDHRRFGISLDYLIRHCCLNTHFIKNNGHSCRCLSTLSLAALSHNAGSFIDIIIDSQNSNSSIKQVLEADIVFALYIAALIGNDEFSQAEIIICMKRAAILVDQISLDYSLSKFSPLQVFNAVSTIIPFVKIDFKAVQLCLHLLAWSINTIKREGQENPISKDEKLLISEMEGNFQELNAIQSEASLLYPRLKLPTWRYEIIDDSWIPNSLTIGLVEKTLNRNFADTHTAIHNDQTFEWPELSSCIAESTDQIEDPELTIVKRQSKPKRFNRRIASLMSGSFSDDPIIAETSAQQIRREIREPNMPLPSATSEQFNQMSDIISSPHSEYHENSHSESFSRPLRPRMDNTNFAITILKKRRGPCSFNYVPTSPIRKTDDSGIFGSRQIGKRSTLQSSDQFLPSEETSEHSPPQNRNRKRQSSDSLLLSGTSISSARDLNSDRFLPMSSELSHDPLIQHILPSSEINESELDDLLQ